MDEDFGASYITIEDDEGNEFELEHLGTVEFEDSEYMVFLPADMDEDGEITIMDATRVQRIIAELVARPDEAFLVSIDADGDGELTILDATRIQRVLAELCDWDGNIPGQDGESGSDELPFVPAIVLR